MEAKLLSFNDLAIGIDLGLQSFAKFSNGQNVDDPRFFRADENELPKARRKPSKAEKGTPERAKRRKAVRQIDQRIANRRSDFAPRKAVNW